MESLSIKKTNLLLYACTLMLCLFILARDIIGVGIPGMVFAVMVATAGLVLKIDQFKIFLFFLFPFTCGVPGYTMLVSIIVLVAKSLGKVPIRRLQILPVVFVALLELFNCLIHVGDVDISGYASFISFTAVFFFILFDKSNYKQSRECLIAFILGTLFVCVVIYYKMITEYGLDMILMGHLRGAMGDVNKEGTGKLITNGNNVAYLSIVLISILLLGAKRLKMLSSLCNSLLMLSILIGMGSFSRTWMLLFASIIVVYLLYQRSLKMLFVLVLISGILILIFPNILDGFTNVMTERMTSENIGTMGGRSTIFSHYNEIWSQKLLYILFGTSVTFHNDVLNYYIAMHNMTQQIYVCIGVIGLLLYVYLFGRFFKEKYAGNKTLINYLPFFAGIMFLQSIQFLQPYFLMLPLLPAFYAFFIRSKK